ncbi:2Fe-2S ferredoxin-like protein [Psychrosphaera sp. B3R10]|uniref:Class I ribonucleotide reductase maintenance protein YfaE n=1 Tax=Psychrosphaera algicola TaxID=3023714 RepID=A0ABT5F8Q4_9GAMM|nr:MULTISPECIES: class I ribonucleotide reductase maintenance protein YfaE [unclassified Psychrosphaera]MBU2882356.1 2Fe-2S ferredoxin-like protein [Psychrosphaera sp. I2R16]MBU2989037.1 2Fe-2S ferredoxin-like protein [Psychrosphaera sp. B3R10]MDC2887924.1 class I ribonucleotide reductase maintenance protein YfaE [Psychrosphaera sp. G1-22]MDO6718033.1 class I ribonucleotide reductase maintenance protein YfaE [Psychrosphaera sp. 1_MG-2023]
MSKIRVLSQQEVETEFEFQSGDKTLLTSLLNQKLDVLYHCREGFCGACRCKLKSGTVEYINEPLAFVRKGEILTCCSKPTTDIEIEIKF